MLSIRRTVAAGLLALAVAGCASSGTTTSAGPRRTDSSAISREQIDEQTQAGATNAYEIVQRLRPRWLVSRGPRSIGDQPQILVYMEQVRLGGLEAMRNIDPTTVESMRRLDSSQAVAQLPGLGSAKVESVIVLNRRRR